MINYNGLNCVRTDKGTWVITSLGMTFNTCQECMHYIDNQIERKKNLVTSVCVMVIAVIWVLIAVLMR